MILHEEMRVLILNGNALDVALDARPNIRAHHAVDIGGRALTPLHLRGRNRRNGRTSLLDGLEMVAQITRKLRRRMLFAVQLNPPQKIVDAVAPWNRKLGEGLRGLCLGKIWLGFCLGNRLKIALKEPLEFLCQH